MASDCSLGWEVLAVEEKGRMVPHIYSPTRFPQLPNNHKTSGIPAIFG